MAAVNKATKSKIASAKSAESKTDALTAKIFNFVQELTLNWTYKSIDVLNSELGVSLAQLRTCVFATPQGTTVSDVAKAARLLLMAGWIKDIHSYDLAELEERAYGTLEEFRSECGSITILHSIMVQQLTDRHFFIADGDIERMQKVGEMYPSVSDVAKAHLASATQEMMQQVISYNT